MAGDEQEHPWRLPGAVKGQDIKLGGNASSALSAPAKVRLHRIASKAPEVMVKITGRTRSHAGHLKRHLDYITRNSRIVSETQDGQRITDRTKLRALHDDWLLANAVQARGKRGPNATQSVSIILSMQPGTPPDKVEAAVRTWARETFGGQYDWIMARHDDTDHPHVHVAVRAVGRDGLRLAPGPADLQQWRERFARELRRLGIEAEATPRQARGHVPKAERLPVNKIKQRGLEPRVQKAQRHNAQREAHALKPPPPRDWSRDIQARQEAIGRAYLTHADELGQGDAADRQLARDLRRFVADMPVPLTRRQALAAELRHVLEQHPGRGTPPMSSSPNSAQVPRRENQAPAPETKPSVSPIKSRG
jgi:type IV secretion system T-DNA border endonuclease VirD2